MKTTMPLVYDASLEAMSPMMEQQSANIDDELTYIYLKVNFIYFAFPSLSLPMQKTGHCSGLITWPYLRKV